MTSLKYCPKEINGYFDFYENPIKKESLINFNSVIKGYIKSEFGNKEEILNEVKKKLIKEKKELNKLVLTSHYFKNKQKRL